VSDSRSKNFIIGSGPAAVGAALALDHVHVVDSGGSLESAPAERAASLGRKAPSTWPKDDVEWLKSTLQPNTNGVETKLSFGSRYPYEIPESGPAWDVRGGLKPSFAFGGLSTVWGASVLPYRQEEIQKWPITLKELEPHYRAVLAETGVAGVRDDLEEIFPSYHEAPSLLQTSPQAMAVLARWHKNRKKLAAGGFRWGRSRLLVEGKHAEASAGRLSYHGSNELAAEKACVECGMCMYGCPYDLIYSSRKSIRKWHGEGKINYEAGVLVEGFKELADRVEVWGLNLSTGAEWKGETERLFLGAGVLSSTAMVMRSLGIENRPVEILDSQYFTVPLLSFRGTAGVRESRLHTLAQIFLEIMPGEISKQLIHLQIYTYNDMITRVLQQKAGPLASLLDPMIRQMEGRLFFLQGYLHSDDSGRLRIKMVTAHDGQKKFLVEPRVNPKVVGMVRKVLAKLASHLGDLGFCPILPMASLGEPGRGFHSGGSMPMGGDDRRHPIVTDRLGRPNGLKRVHVIDASTFPSISATTITLTAMANARRIACEAGELE
jgi:choline dehydrogenase-like flavoprotein